MGRVYPYRSRGLRIQWDVLTCLVGSHFPCGHYGQRNGLTCLVSPDLTQGLWSQWDVLMCLIRLLRLPLQSVGMNSPRLARGLFSGMFSHAELVLTSSWPLCSAGFKKQTNKQQQKTGLIFS